MAKQKPTSIADITEILHTRLPDEVLAVPGETTLDTVKRILSAIVPEEAGSGGEGSTADQAGSVGGGPKSDGKLSLKDGKSLVTLNRDAKAGETVLLDVLHDGSDELTIKMGKEYTNLVVPEDQLLVNKRLFFELFSSMVRGQYIRYLNVAGMSRIATIMGAKDRIEEKKCFAECEQYLKQHKH